MLFFDGETNGSTAAGAISAHALANHYATQETFDFSVSNYGSDSEAPHIEKLRQIDEDMAFQLKKAQLQDFVPASIPFLSAADKAYWHALLSGIFEGQLYLYHYHQVTSRKQYLADDLKTLKQLKSYLLLLNADEGEVSPAHSALSMDSAQLADDIQGIEHQLCHCPSVAMRKWLSELNWYRLYWIWVGGGGGLLSGILDSLNQSDASSRLDSPAPILSAVSYSLYFTRLAFHLILMFKHLVPGPWMSKEEKALIPPMERFLKEWHKRKFVIINDIVWGGINLATANWLFSGMTDHAKLLGAWGGFLNVVLMSVDIAVSIWQLREEEQQYKQEEIKLKAELRQIKRSLNGLEPADRRNVLLRQQKKAQVQLETLTENWHYRRQTLVMARNIAIAFVPVMILICAPLFPPLIPIFALSHAALNAMVVTGGVAATGLTILQSWHSYQVEIDKLEAKLDKLAERENDLLSERSELLALSSRDEDQTKRLKLLTIEHQKLQKDALYHQAMIQHQRAGQVFSVLSQIVFPLVTIGALFASPPAAIAIIVLAAILLLATKAVINRYKPVTVDNDAIKLEDGDDKKAIESVLSRRLEPKKSSGWSFFKKTKLVPEGTSTVSESPEPLLG